MVTSLSPAGDKNFAEAKSKLNSNAAVSLMKSERTTE